jgi:hypothetical protein
MTAEPDEHEEIEITQEMMKAGLRAYRRRDSRVMLDEDVVEDIFSSMMEVVQKGAASGADDRCGAHDGRTE